MQHQLVGMEPVLAKEQVMLDEHEHGAGGRVTVLVEELVRQNKAQILTRMHIPTIGATPRGQRVFPIGGNWMRIVVTSGAPEDPAPHPIRPESKDVTHGSRACR